MKCSTVPASEVLAYQSRSRRKSIRPGRGSQSCDCGSMPSKPQSGSPTGQGAKELYGPLEACCRYLGAKTQGAAWEEHMARSGGTLSTIPRPGPRTSHVQRGP